MADTRDTDTMTPEWTVEHEMLTLRLAGADVYRPFKAGDYVRIERTGETLPVVDAYPPEDGLQIVWVERA